MLRAVAMHRYRALFTCKCPAGMSVISSVKRHRPALLAVRFVAERDRVVRDLPRKVDSLGVTMFAGAAIEPELAAFDYSVFHFHGLARRVAQCAGNTVAFNLQIDYDNAGAIAPFERRCPAAAGIVGLRKSKTRYDRQGQNGVDDKFQQFFHLHPSFLVFLRAE